MSIATLVEEPSTRGSTAAGLLAGPTVPMAWRAETQSAAWEKFNALPMPARTDEAWRFSARKALDLSLFHAPSSVPDSVAEELASRTGPDELAETAGRMVFANDQLLKREVRSDAARQAGVLWLPIEQAAREHGDLFHKHFMQEEARLGSKKFAALHEAWMRNGTFLYVPRGVEIDVPFETYHWLHGSGSSCFPHTLILAAEQSKVTLVDYFGSYQEDEPGFACGVNDLWLGPGAKVTYVNVQNWGHAVRAVQINSTMVGRDAHAVALTANLGGGYLRNESISHLRGAGGRSDMLSYSIVQENHEIDQRTLQIHEVPNTSSDLLYKNALFDQARTIFAGLIRVDPGAHYTDAYQKVRNLLLSDDAEANSAPGLEIEADNVRCTHGATSGQIEEEELFYLLSRGIPREAAQRLIVHGFLYEVLARLPDEAIREKLRRILERMVA